MEFEFIPVDYSSFDWKGRNYVRVVGRSKGKRVCVVDDCDVYFWAILKKDLDDKQIKKVTDKIDKISVESGSRVSKVIRTEVHDKKFLNRDVKAVKIFVTNHKDLVKVAEKLPHKYIEHVREHDLNFVTRYIIEKKLVPMNFYKVLGDLIGGDDFGGIGSVLDVDLCLKLNSVKKIEKKLFNPKVLAFDIETDEFEIGKGEVLMISLVSDDVKKVLTWKKCKGAGKDVEFFEDEAEMLEGFVNYINEISPDIITGYFSDGFDLPYLKARAEKNKVKLKLGVDGSNVRFSGGRSPRGKVSGIVHVDLLQFIQTAYSQYLQSETLSLNEVSSELLGDKKVDYEFKPSLKMSNDDWKKFFEYNLHDSVLTYNLFFKVWPDMLEFSRVMQEPLFEVSRNGMSSNVESYIVHNLEKYNEIIEKRPVHDEISKRREREKYEGAFVLQPVPKLYENIVMFDFTSYWPSIIASFNFSRSTFLGDNFVKGATEVEVGNKKFYFSKDKGFFPEMLEEIIQKRKKYKAEYKKSPSAILKARSNAFKLLANASYGYQGFFGARYYCPEASAATTAVSRDFIKKVISESEKNGFKAIYSDTDSIALELNKKTKKQALDFLKKINNKLPGIMELELEDFYRRGIWVTTRKGDFGAKKKYALISDGGKFKIRGFETVRRDWCNLARELQNKILELILEEGDEKKALDYLKKVVKDIRNRKVDKKSLIIRTQLKKPLSEYRANTPHITIARKMIEEDMPVNVGMLIEYYIAESSNKKALTRDKAVFFDENKLYDVDYYLDKQVLPAVENIFHVFGVDVKEVIDGNSQTTLF